MTRQTLLSTIAKRKAMAVHVGRISSECLGRAIELTPSELYPGEFHFRGEDLESERGPVSWLHIDVCSRGVNLHIKFGFAQYAPWGASRPSGKWNHYLWPDHEDDSESYRRYIETELRRLLPKVQLVDSVRADRPCMGDYWLYEREQFAAQCAARDAVESAHA